MPKRTEREISDYVEWQSNHKCKVLSAKPEHSFSDLGKTVNVWNVKTDSDGAWWVVEGESVPMNLYPQGAYYFSSDEVYSFHMGLMRRMSGSLEYKPEDFVNALTLNNAISPPLFRKLKIISGLIDSAVEIEDFQSIGVQSREILIELGNLIYSEEMAQGNEQPKAADFKRKAELFIQSSLSGTENHDYRSIYKKLTESVWDYVNKITHSRNSTYYDASTCVTLCISLVSIYENIHQKHLDPFSGIKCENCHSKRLKIINDEGDDEGIVTKLVFECEECNHVTEIAFDNETKN
jgi:hypothetical protein